MQPFPVNRTIMFYRPPNQVIDWKSFVKDNDLIFSFKII